MTTLSVGQLYNPLRTQWPECSQYNYRSGAHELLLFFGSPTDREVKAARKGKAEFALFVRQPVIILAYKFGDGIPWSDAVFSIHLVPESERDLPSADLESEVRATLQVLLVDAHTGILRALRLVSFSPAFTRALHTGIREQAAAPWDSARYDAAVAELYALYPSSEAFVRVAQARCTGGV